MATYYVDGAVGSDANAGTSPGTGNAWATIAHGLSTMAGGDTLNVKSSATYNETVTLTPPAGTSLALTRVIGYTATPGDGGQVTVKAAAATANWQLINPNLILRNFIYDFNATATAGFFSNGSNLYLTIENCVALNVPSNRIGFLINLGDTVRFSIAKPAASSSGNVGFKANSGGTLDICVADGAFASAVNTNGFGMFIRRFIARNPVIGISAANRSIINGLVVYNSSSDGVTLGSYQGVSITNSILALVGGFGINCTGGTLNDLTEDYNAFKATSGPTHNFTQGAHDVALSGDPFVNATAVCNTIADYLAAFALNTTAGAGAACRGAGYPANLDIGAVQSQATGGGGGSANPLSLILQPTNTY